MVSPYKAKQRSWVRASTGNAVADDRMPYFNTSGSLKFANERMGGANGEINASSTKELMKAIASIQAAVASKAYVQETQVDPHEKEKLSEMVSAALADKNCGPAWQALGEVIGEEIFETQGRQGFAQKTLIRKDLKKNEIGRIKIRKKDVLAHFATRNPEVLASQVRQTYAYPPEFYLLGRVLIEDAEIEQSPGDLLQDKYEDGLEQIMVAEDKVWKRLADAAASTYNNPFLFNTMTPAVFAAMQNQVMRWGIPVHMALISFDLWPDITTDTEFSTWFDPVSKHEIVMTGYVGQILGTQIHTDGFRYETLQVLQPGECYFMGSPENLGAITIRQDVASAPISLHALGRPERGWFLSKIEGMILQNARALVKGQKF